LPSRCTYLTAFRLRAMQPLKMFDRVAAKHLCIFLLLFPNYLKVGHCRSRPPLFSIFHVTTCGTYQQPPYHSQLYPTISVHSLSSCLLSTLHLYYTYILHIQSFLVTPSKHSHFCYTLALFCAYIDRPTL